MPQAKSEQAAFFFQRYSAEGVKVGGEVLVNQNIAPENRVPEVVALDGGGFAIAWIELSPASPNQLIEYFTRAYDASGTPERGAVKVNQQYLGKENDYYEDRLDLIATPDGGFMVTFASADWTPNTDIELGRTIDSSYDPVVFARQKFNANGSKNGSNEILDDVHAPNLHQNGGPVFLLGDNIYYGDWSSGILSGGRQVYVWDGNYYQEEVTVDDVVTVPGYGFEAQDGTVTDLNTKGGLYYRIVDSNGNQTTVARKINDNFRSAEFPDLAVLNNDKFVVVWLQSVAGGDYEIHGQMFNSSGNETGAEFVVSDSTDINNDCAPKVIRLAGGRFVVAWDQIPGVSGHTIQAQIFNANGTPDGGVVELASSDGMLMSEFDIVATIDGGFFLTWDETELVLPETGGFFFDGDVFLKRFDGSGQSVDLGSVDLPVDRDITVKMKEDKTFKFDRDDFGCSEPDGGAFNSLKIKSLPKNGVLKLNGERVTDEQRIGLNQIDDLTFRPKKDWFGNTSFKFQVKDADGFGDQFTFKIKVTDVVDVITGNNKKNVLTGTKGKDKISGLKGDDTLTGDKGKDIFVFETGWDSDTITDFQATGRQGDKLDLRGVNSIKSFNDLKKNHMEKQGKHVLIDAGNGDEVLLKNVKMSDLDSGDFLV